MALLSIRNNGFPHDTILKLFIQRRIMSMYIVFVFFKHVQTAFQILIMQIKHWLLYRRIQTNQNVASQIIGVLNRFQNIAIVSTANHISFFIAPAAPSFSSHCSDFSDMIFLWSYMLSVHISVITECFNRPNVH